MRFTVLVLLLISVPANAGEVLVAVASNFAPALAELRAGFEAESGHRLVVSSGSTGKLYAQIRNGAPFDVFMAADQERPALLETDGLAVAGSRFTYAEGRLVLASAERELKNGLVEIVREPGIRLAIANPSLAPYGRAARQALEALDAWETASGRVVMGENVGQAQSMVVTGNVDAGFISLAGVVSGPAATLSYVDVPIRLYQPIRQDAVLLAHGANNEAAVAFVAYVRSAAVRERIAALGYGAGA